MKFKEEKQLKRRLLCSIGAGMLAVILLGSPPYQKPEAKAWWGVLYPQYCYSQIPGNSGEEDVQIRIRFRWLHGL